MVFAQKYGWDNTFADFRTLLDRVLEQYAAEKQWRWIVPLAGVGVLGASHCRAALIEADRHD